MKSILDPAFCYIPSTHTDIAKTFARVRREQRNAMAAVAVVEADQGACKDYLVLLRAECRRADVACFSGEEPQASPSRLGEQTRLTGTALLSSER